MQKDLFGKTRFRVNLHTHTSVSDGNLSPADVFRRYRSEGYDAIALTDHWKYGAQTEADGLLVLSGVEYNIRNTTSREGLFHIVGVGMTRDPKLPKFASAQEAIDAIRAAEGLAVIAHPAWSLNTPAHILALRGGEATEIYNSVSAVHESRRPDSGLLVDMLGAAGRFYPLIADDDAHYYDGSDDCRAWIMVEAEALTREDLLQAVRAGKFYATQGPEVHLSVHGNEAVVRCSPCREIVLFSDLVWSNDRARIGKDLTEFHYSICPGEHFLRAEVTDANGNRAWTNCVLLPDAPL